MGPIVPGGRPPAQINQAGVPYKYGGGYMPQPQMPNAPTNMAEAAPQMQPNQVVNAVQVQGHAPLTAKMLAGADPAAQKNMLGERLFPLIERMYPDEVGKITGMLLEIDNSEILHMLEHPEALASKIEEAVAVLRLQQTK